MFVYADKGGGYSDWSLHLTLTTMHFNFDSKKINLKIKTFVDFVFKLQIIKDRDANEIGKGTPV